MSPTRIALGLALLFGAAAGSDVLDVLEPGRRLSGNCATRSTHPYNPTCCTVGESSPDVAGCKGGVTLNTQTQVDEFGDRGCIFFSGALMIQHVHSGTVADPITNLDKLNLLHSVCGSVTIQQTDLTDITGLQNLAYIKGSLSVQANSYLQKADVIAGLQGAQTYATVNLQAANGNVLLCGGVIPACTATVCACPAAPDPVPAPSSAPSNAPTPSPTPAPSSAPTDSPTDAPTDSPTDSPTPSAITPSPTPSPFASADPYEPMTCNGTDYLHRYDDRSACCEDLSDADLGTFLAGLDDDAIEEGCNAHLYYKSS